MVRDLPPDCWVMNPMEAVGSELLLEKEGRAEVSTVGTSFHNLEVPRALHLTPPCRTSCVLNQLATGSAPTGKTGVPSLQPKEVRGAACRRWTDKETIT
jgi:hypothetical protein